ncbi:protein translocase subunit SecY [Clostridia bacterium]|nr:protein translocase subunit SecY [Clostridia bacterium]GHU74598.1 protein translocase subunit SecY [Clostridia bacterium]
MFTVFANAWKIPDIRKRMLYTILIVLIYRLACHIPLPFIDLNALTAYKSGGSGPNTFYAMMLGGGLGTVAAMGIGPYINASIIMQLLTVALPPLEKLQKEGEQAKISQITRIVAVGLACLQGIGLTYSYSFQGIFKYHMLLAYITAAVVMVTGTIFIMWLAELLTEKAIGNGASFIVFANILAGLPTGVIYLQSTLNSEWITWVKAIFVLIIFVIIIGFVIFVQDGERRISVQYSKKMVGRQLFGGNTSYIPIKVNIAGVMSIIFAISLLQIPQFLHGFFTQNETLGKLTSLLSISHPVGAISYVVLIFIFTFFYSSFALNPLQIAENMRKNGGFIPGVRSGKPTSDYIQLVVDRLSWVGATFYAVIAMIPVIMQWTMGLDLGFGGTTILIITGVGIDIMKQMESRLLMRHYKGFLE